MKASFQEKQNLDAIGQIHVHTVDKFLYSTFWKMNSPVQFCRSRLSTRFKP